MRGKWLVLLAAALLAGCASALPSSSQYPLPVASAAQPGVSGQGEMSYARRGAEALRASLRGTDPDEALERIPVEGVNLPEDRVEAGCAGAPGDKVVLVCHFGPSAAQPVAQVILWHDGEGWQSQLYPQASIKMAEERRRAMEPWGCSIGCYSGISRARQAGGGELLVVVNLGHATGTQHAEEVQLLHLKDNRWQVLWVPGHGDWNYSDAQVVLAAKGTQLFQVHNSSRNRQDRLSGYLAEQAVGEHRRFTEQWERKGSAYRMRDQVEHPSPLGALARLIHYLSTGADEKALDLLSPELNLEEIRKNLAQQPQRQGWNVVRWGTNGYLLETAKAGKPQMGVRFEPKGSGWVLAEVWKVKQ